MSDSHLGDQLQSLNFGGHMCIDRGYANLLERFNVDFEYKHVPDLKSCRDFFMLNPPLHSRHYLAWCTERVQTFDEVHLETLFRNSTDQPMRRVPRGS
jgi:hypothetical protein